MSHVGVREQHSRQGEWPVQRVRGVLWQMVPDVSKEQAGWLERGDGEGPEQSTRQGTQGLVGLREDRLLV